MWGEAGEAEKAVVGYFDFDSLRQKPILGTHAKAFKQGRKYSRGSAVN
jgi:hypothetical protein